MKNNKKNHQKYKSINARIGNKGEVSDLTLYERFVGVGNRDRLVAMGLYFLVYLLTIMAAAFLIRGIEQFGFGVEKGIYNPELFFKYGMSVLDFEIFALCTLLPLCYICLGLVLGISVLIPSHFNEKKFGKTGRIITLVIVIFSLSLFQDKLGSVPAIALAILGLL